MTTSEASTTPPNEETWQPPEIQRPVDQAAQRRSEDAERKARREQAHQEGYEAGLAAAAEDAAKQAAAVGKLLNWLAKPVEDRSEEVEAALLDLLATITRLVLRQEMSSDPAHVVGVIREAMTLLPISAGDIEITVHPDDAKLLETALAPADEDRAWQLASDPLMGRGEFRLLAGASEIDGSLETRLNNVLGPLLSERRQNPRGNDAE